MRHCLMSVLLIGLVVLAVSPATADREVIVRPVDVAEFTELFMGPQMPAQDCQVGNLNAPYWALGGFIYPPEEYKLVFDPQATCNVCTMGFMVTFVHVLLQTDAACDIIMAVDVEEAVFPNDPSCAEPGPEWCNSGLYQVAIPQAGLWNISLPIGCPCLDPDRIYLLSLEIESVSCATVPALIMDQGPPTLCTNWNNYGTGWYDLFAEYPTWAGNLLFYADADCCTPPVPVENRTWGAIKALFDD